MKSWKKEELLKKLYFIKEVDTSDNRCILSPKITEMLKSNSAEIIEIITNSNNRWWKKDYTKEDLIEDYSKKENWQDNPWSTYEGCRDFTFKYYNEDKLYSEICIYEGDNYSGSREQFRFTLKLYLDIDFIDNIESIIDATFEDYMENLYEEELQKQKREWINKWKSNCFIKVGN